MIDHATIGYCLEGLLVLVGLGLIVQYLIHRRRDPAPAIDRLPQHDRMVADVVFFLVAMMVPMALGLGAATLAAKNMPDLGLAKIQLGATYVQEFAMIAAILGYARFWGGARPRSSAAAPAGLPGARDVEPRSGPRSDYASSAPEGRAPPAEPDTWSVPVLQPKLPAFRTGVITFVAAMPLVFLVAAAWQSLLTLINRPPEHQTIVDLFLGLDTPVMQVLFIIVAAVLVPISEEFIFRNGLFRGLRAGLPRKYAIVISAIVFGAAHGDLTSFLPLVALGIVFAVAYERTGNIGTVIVAHALFNLNTLVALLLGVNA